MVSTVHDEDEELVACDELALHAPNEFVDCPVVNTEHSLERPVERIVHEVISVVDREIPVIIDRTVTVPAHVPYIIVR